MIARGDDVDTLRGRHCTYTTVKKMSTRWLVEGERGAGARVASAQQVANALSNSQWSRVAPAQVNGGSADPGIGLAVLSSSEILAGPNFCSPVQLAGCPGGPGEGSAKRLLGTLQNFLPLPGLFSVLPLSPLYHRI